MKRCPACGIEKSLDEFYRARRGDGRQSYCKPCQIERNRQWRERHPEQWKAIRRRQEKRRREQSGDRVRELDRGRDYAGRSRAALLKRNYGISVARYDELLAAQAGVCAICGNGREANGRRQRQLAVDHDHSTGAVRGLLCDSCNNLLAWAHDDPQRLSRAVVYLASPPAFG